MNYKIKILHLEDSLLDSRFIYSFIESSEIRHEYFLAADEKNFLNILETENIDIILSDYNLPDYDGNQALKVVNEKYSHIPFIFVSGKIGEDAAIDALLRGATDYVLKNKLERLVPAITRAMREHELNIKHKRDEEALRVSEEKYRLMIETLDQGIWHIDKDFCTTFVNPSMAGILGYTIDEMLGKHLFKFMDDRGIKLARYYLKRRQNGIKEQQDFEFIRKDGSHIYTIVSISPIVDTNGYYLGAVAGVRDITDQKKAEQELIFQNGEKEKRAEELLIAKEKAEESDKLKTAFLQNMSHEIRTPLSVIIGFSDLLNNEDLSKDEIKEYTDAINQSGKRLIEIVNNVLDISKIQTGQIKIEKKPILINSLFSDLLTLFLPIAKAKNISLNFHHRDDQYRTIYSDEAKLNQILTNLINNAVKFTKSGSIDYGFEIKDNFVQLYVKDSGIGIPHELTEWIFERFIQAEQSTTRNYEGAGLGLAISKGLVELLGGHIWVESETGNGSTFFFTLPYTPDGETTPTDLEQLKIPGKRAHGKILVAEDDWLSFQYLRNRLVKSDNTVIHAENGEKAIDLVRNTPDIDLILMDIRMPVMDGIEAIKQIKQIRPDLPIIAQTAYAFSEEKNKILSIGCDEYLAKPLEYAKLDALINKYLN